MEKKDLKIFIIALLIFSLIFFLIVTLFQTCNNAMVSGILRNSRTISESKKGKLYYKLFVPLRDSFTIDNHSYKADTFWTEHQWRIQFNTYSKNDTIIRKGLNIFTFKDTLLKGFEFDIEIISKDNYDNYCYKKDNFFSVDFDTLKQTDRVIMIVSKELDNKKYCDTIEYVLK